MSIAPASIEDYLQQFDGEARERLETMRALVLEIAPDATESMSYGLIGYKRNGKPLVYVGAFPKHIGFYATPNGHQAFQKEFAAYKQGKGSVQLPLDQPFPEQLVRRVIEFRSRQTDEPL